MYYPSLKDVFMLQSHEHTPIATSDTRVLRNLFHLWIHSGFRDCLRCRRRSSAAKRRRRRFELPAAVDGVTFPIHCIDQRHNRCHRHLCRDCQQHRQQQQPSQQLRRVAETECAHYRHRRRRPSDDVICSGIGAPSASTIEPFDCIHGGSNKRVFFAELSTI